MTRTALAIVQDAATRLGIAQPDQLFAATGRTEIEVRAALNEAKDKIVRAHDWQLLKTLQSHVGDGTTTEFAVPSDFLRMPKDAQVWSTRWQRPLFAITPEDWLNLDIRAYNIVTGAWTIYGGNFVYEPALTTTESAKFFYIANKAVADSGGAALADFAADDDTFRLDSRVLELTLVAQYRMQKGFDYAEELAEAETALSRAIEADKGSRILTQRSSGRLGAPIAYPLDVSVS